MAAAALVACAACLAGNALLYVKGLEYSHMCAYNTLRNIRTALQQKLEVQPLGTIRELGNGRIKKMFTDDIETIEILLAHAIPEGIGNLLVPTIVIVAMFFVDWKLALLCIASLPLGLLAMGMMYKAGMRRMETYYGAAAKMNNTIIEYINGMEVLKVFNRVTAKATGVSKGYHERLSRFLGMVQGLFGHGWRVFQRHTHCVAVPVSQQ